MDSFDLASLQEEKTRERELERQRVSAIQAPKLRPLGYCLNPRCGDDFPPGDLRLFCSSRCAK